MSIDVAALSATPLSLTPGLGLLVAIFLALLYFAFLVLTDPFRTVQRSIDLLVFGAVFVLALLYIQTDVSFEDIARKEVLRPVLSASLKLLDSPGTLYLCGAVVLVVSVASWVLPSLPTLWPVSVAFALQLCWTGLVLCGANELTKLVFQYSIFRTLDNLLWYGTTDPEEEVRRKATAKQYGEDGEEVFHIGNQLYRFSEADELCRIKGAKLATRAQLEEAQAHGADWLGSYGWTEGQHAYTVSPDEGVRGGRIADPDLLLGVNCYGKKPEMTDRDRLLLSRLRAQARGVDTMSQVKLLFAQLNPEEFASTRPFSGDAWKAFSCALKSDTLSDAVVNTQVGTSASTT